MSPDGSIAQCGKWKPFSPGINPKISPTVSGERASWRVRKRGVAMEGESEGDWERGRERQSELFRESIWRSANGYAGIMFLELFVGPQCVCMCVEGGFSNVIPEHS